MDETYTQDSRNKSGAKPFITNTHPDAGWSSPVARQAHNLKVTGSNPVPAPTDTNTPEPKRPGVFCLAALSTPCRSSQARIAPSSPWSVASISPRLAPDPHRLAYLAHQAWTPSRFKKASARPPWIMARVDRTPASIQVGAATVTERGASLTGQPVRGLRM